MASNPPAQRPSGSNSFASQDWGQLSSLEVLVCGGVAGGISRTTMAPLDRIRLVFQATPRAFTFRGAVGLGADIARLDGAEGLFRGHAATLWRVIPFAGLQFLVYHKSRAELLPRIEALGLPRESWSIVLAQALSCGALAGATATVATYPLDLIRTRLVANIDSTPRYKSYASAVEEITRTEGFRGLFRGISATLLGMVPYAALSFSTFEVSKHYLRGWHGVTVDSEVPLHQRFIVGSASGVVAQLSSYPLCIVRRRMQMMDGQELGAQGSIGYATTRSTLMQIHRSEGMTGLFKGASLTWIKGPATIGLAFTLNDALKGAVQRRHLGHEGDQFVPLPGRGHHVAGADGAAVKLKAIESLVCGGIAGAVAKTVIAPGDRLKIIYQTDPKRPFKLHDVRNTALEIVRTQGIRGMWQGHGATLLRVVPYSATTFTVFDPYKVRLRQAMPEASDVTVRFLAGAAAGATSTSITYPLDMMRARMAAHRGPEGSYNGYLHAIRQISKNEGFAALWNGLNPTLLGIIPYSGISFSLFETLKQHIRDREGLQSDRDIGTGPRLAAGAFAGLVAQSATYPLDVVRRKMQVRPAEYPSISGTVLKVVSEEGAMAFFKGLSMNWIKGPLAISISFAVNDALRDRVRGAGREKVIT
eukprot:TRINITY_DN40494_c0_g1_i1.p1 TRINITY_DN40494_c0_g1~~TRINITY_DN40494_c0_g1_i1.p1  ORF type:complete len:645 (-),score=91.26 TRINITY_DN40494_c0_g1_i1:290-2224(-)